MDELDLLKKDWKRQEGKLPKVSFNQIQSMIHKKSSSIVKWILIICMAEFVFWFGINLLIPEKYLEIYNQYHIKTFLNIVQYSHYGIVIIFMYYFYKNYKAISAIDNTTNLMGQIIKTRKTVNYYVYYNIASYVVFSIIINGIIFSNPDTLVEFYKSASTQVSNEKFVSVMMITQIVTLLIFFGLLCLYYRVIYGILLRKLSKNYNELKHLD